MTARPETAPFGTARRGLRWIDDLRFDVFFAAICGWILLGAFTDAWAHSHGITDETFFTPWHAFLYSGFLASVAFAGLTYVRNRRLGLRGLAMIPPGYELTIAGLALFGLGGLGDMVWHELFGIEADLEAAYSPTHLLLLVGLVLIVTGPVRAAWRRPGRQVAQPLPLMLSLAYTLSLFGFLTFFSNPLTTAYPQLRTGDAQALGISSIFVQTLLLMLFMLFLLRRWQLPAGSFLLVFTLVYLGMAVITDEYRFIPVMAATGLVADILNERWRPGLGLGWRPRAFAFVVPAFLFAAYFLTLWLTGGLAWTTHLWAGGIVLSGLTGMGVSLAFWPPEAEAGAG